MRPARALLWACPLYVALLAVLLPGDPGPVRWTAAALIACLLVLVLRRGGLFRRRLRIYLSHRRADSAAETARVVAALRRRYGARTVLVGPPPVRLRMSLRDEVRRAVGRCDAVCVVIGPDWSAGSDGSGRRRLTNVHDPVRVEVETALHAGLPTIPVLVGGAPVPDEHDLPATMRDLAGRVPVSVPEVPDGVGHAGLLERLDAVPRRRGREHRLLLAGVAAALVVPVGAALLRGAAEEVGYLDEPAVAPDGVHVVAVVRGGLWAPPALRIWNSVTGTTDAEYRYGPGEAGAGALAWSPDGAAVAVGGDDGSLVLRRADTLAAVRALPGYRGSFRATGVGWSPDGSRLAAVDGAGTLRIWRAADGAQVAAVPVFPTSTGRAAWSPRSDAVAVRSDEASEVAVVELPSGTVRRLAGPAPPAGLAWAPDGTALAAGFSAAPHLVVFRRTADGFGAQPAAGQDARTGTAAWSPDGTAVATTSDGPAGDGVVRIVDGRTGAATRRFTSDGALAQNPVWAPGGDAVAVGDRAAVTTFPVRGAASGRWASPQEPYGSRLLTWTADDRLLTAGGRDHVVRVWRAGRAAAVAEWSVSPWSLLLPWSR